MFRYWLQREDPPWSEELHKFIIRSRLPGTLALAAAIIATVDIGRALPYLVAFLVGVVVVNFWTFRRAASQQRMPEVVGIIEMAGPVLLGFWIPGLLYAALLMSVTSVVFCRLIYGPRITIIGMIVVVAIASAQTLVNPAPYAAASIAVFFVTGLRLVAALDVLARREFSLADQLRERAERDHLTGLTNRSTFVDEVETRLAKCRAGEARPVRLLYLDVDNFKEVNDTLGHHHGDLFLIEISLRLVAVAPEATVARVGGDEFAILLEEDEEGRSAGVFHRVHQALAEPIEVGDRKLTATVSIGEAIGPEHGSTVVDLINRADLAMYEAKARRSSPSAVARTPVQHPKTDRQQPAGSGPNHLGGTAASEVDYCVERGVGHNESAWR